MTQQKAISQKILNDFRVTLRLFERAIERINQANCLLDINVPQCHTVMEVGLAGTLTVKELAHKMSLDKSTVSRQVEKLVQANLVTRITATNDRRKVNISLTEKGTKIYQIMNTTINEQFEEVFKEIPADDLQVFLKVFAKIARKL